MIKKIKSGEANLLADTLSEEKLKFAAESLRAITHELRLKILDYIDKNPGTSVNSIYYSLGLEQSITSQHLRILRSNNLVKAKRDGKQILYSLNYKKIGKLTDAVKMYLS